MQMDIGPFFWLILLTIGVAGLGVAIAYGMIRNSTRTRREKAMTEVATRKVYADEDRDRPTSDPS